jgi:hypothetical protein
VQDNGKVSKVTGSREGFRSFATSGGPVRAIIAARKSNKVDSATGEGIGLDTRDEKAREFCDRLGITVVGVARDTISGRMAPIDRPDLGAWLADPAGRPVRRRDRLPR